MISRPALISELAVPVKMYHFIGALVPSCQVLDRTMLAWKEATFVVCGMTTPVCAI